MNDVLKQICDQASETMHIAREALLDESDDILNAAKFVKSFPPEMVNIEIEKWGMQIVSTIGALIIIGLDYDQINTLLSRLSNEISDDVKARLSANQNATSE